MTSPAPNLAEGANSTRWVQVVTFRGPVEMVEPYVSSLEREMPRIGMEITRIGAPLELGYVGFFNKRCRVAQKCELRGSSSQLDAVREAIEEDWS